MKLPFSYRRTTWWPSLAGSLVGHGTLFLAVSVVAAPAQFGVTAGFSSLEVVIAPAVPEPRPVADDKVMALDESASAEPSVPVPPPAPMPPPDTLPQPAQASPEQGAQYDAQPGYLQNAPPPYPWTARIRGWEGLVVLKVRMGADGRAGTVELVSSSGHDILDDAAVQAVRRWQFLPARVGGMALASTVIIPIRFQLTDAD